MKKIDINLSEKEVQYLEHFTEKGTAKAREIKRAFILLGLHKGYTHEVIINFVKTSSATIWRIKRKYKKAGIKLALKEEKRSGQPLKYKKKQEAEIIATVCSDAPKGRRKWTLELIKDHVKDKAGLENINRESIRLILKKTNLNLG